MTFLDFCRAANVWLGVIAGLGIGYRAVLGIHQQRIAYPILFAEFATAMVLVGVGSKHAQSSGAPPSWITGCWTVLLSAIVVTCLFHDQMMSLIRNLRSRYGRR